MRLQLPKRWLRFSVRTLLVAVTVFCVWLSWQASIVRERNELRERLQPRATFFEAGQDSLDDLFAPVGPPPPIPRLSWVREAMGDRWVKAITYPDLDPATLERVKAAFPEADLHKTVVMRPLPRNSVKPDVPEEVDRGMMAPLPRAGRVN